MIRTAGCEWWHVGDYQAFVCRLYKSVSVILVLVQIEPKIFVINYQSIQQFTFFFLTVYVSVTNYATVYIAIIVLVL